MSPTKTRKRPPAGANVPAGPHVAHAPSVVGFDFGQYNQLFLNRAGADPVNDAAGIGVRVIPATVTPGQPYWQIIGVHHLTPEENKGKHNLFAEIVDASGQRVREPALQLQWSWEGQQPGEASPAKAFDKPGDEPATSLDLYGGQHVRAFVAGDGCPSDMVENIHTNHPDQHGPGGEVWNSTGHHSFYVVFQRTTKVAAPVVTTGGAETPGQPGGSGGQNGADGATPTPPPVMGRIRVAEKLGIDANRPIDPRTGAIADQVADPRVIADTGAGWVRLNFVLGQPWSNPLDEKRPHELTWAETYHHIIDGFRRSGLKVYGLISAEAMDKDPGESFRNPIAGPLSHEWIGRYAETVAQIVALFPRDVEYFELFNEPDDWHGSNCNWVHPEWFALMLQEVYNKVHSNPATRHVKLISGPLQGLDINGNAGARYLRQTYQAGKRFFGWGQMGVPFPFDGVGYHLYIAQNPANIQAEIGAQYQQYMDGVRRVIREEEGADKPIFLSEFGWQNSVTGDARQVECMRVGAECMVKDPGVALGIWFCTQDFDEKFGLYRQGSLSADNRKPVYNAFKQLCASEVEAPMVALSALFDGASHIPGADAIAQGAIVQPGQRFAQRWMMRNTGSKPWGFGYKLVWVGDKSLGAPPVVDAPACPPGEQVAITAPFIAPSETGSYKSTWQMCNEKGELFGDQVSMLVNVAAAVTEQPAAAATYPPPTGQGIDLPASASDLERTVANTWNRFGGLLLAEANRLGISPAVAVAVLATEANGEPFGPDGRLLIRFENHLFYRYWGQQHDAQFRQHFAFNPAEQWKGHQWRPDANAAWQSFHGNQNAEWQVLDFARRLDEQSALLSLAMGAPQIMGFNHATVGYATVQEMFVAFCSDVRHQLTSLFRFMEMNGLVDAVRRGDYLAFARVYNGPGQAEFYKSRIEAYLAAYQALRGVAPVQGVAPARAAAPLPAGAPAAAGMPGLPAPKAASIASPLVATALGIIYQTYWLRVLAAASEPNPQQAMQAAADDALARIRALM